MATSHRIVSRDGEPYPEDMFRRERIPGTGLILLDNARGNKNVSVSPLVLLQAYHDIVTRFPKQSAYRQRYDRLLDSLAKTNPNSALVLSSLAHRELVTGTPQGAREALLYLKKAVASGFAPLSDYVVLAELLVRSGQPQKGISVLKQTLSLAPYNPLLYQDLAVAYWFAGEVEACSDTARRGLELFPGDPVDRAMLKRCKQSSGGLE